jgi:REP element-mobilizing transposase RayT
MDFFKNKYRIASARAPFWDYAQNGAYFITICTKHRIPWFGWIENGEMELSEIGKVVLDCWMEIPQHFPFVVLDAFVIMPDHVHGIIQIEKSDSPATTVETQDLASLQNHREPKNKFGPQSRNLASVVRGFKIGVTQKSRLINPGFAWQARYHDHIIRDERAHETIALYIENNPWNWIG